MAKALKTIGTIVVAVVAAAVIVTAVATGAGIAALLAAPSIIGGISVGGLIAIGAGISMAGSLLAPKAKAPSQSSANATRLQVSINLRAPRTIVFGHTAMNTDLRDQEWSADQSHLHRFIVCASHKVQSIEEIWFDDKQAWTSGGGAQGEFVGYLTVNAILEGSAANAINISARMGSSRRYTGCAYVHLDYKLTGNTKKTDSPFAQSIPTRVTIVGKGAPVYDPRKDSTVGGSGSQRANDQTTWAWDDDAARNPVLQQLWYELGWRIQNPVTSAWKLAVGKGIPPARLNLASYIDAANLCDEMVAKAAGGTEPRYRSDGVFNESDDPATVRENLKAACNGTLDDIDGKIRITVLHNDLAAPIGDLGTADVIGAYTWTQTPPLDQSINIIRGGYTDPSTTSLYQLADYPEVSFASPDGIDRPQTVNLPLVQSPSQAQRLVKLRLQRAVFGGVFEATFQATAWRFQKGDVIRFTFAPLGWTNKLFRIADTAVQVDGTVPMVLREEDAALYPATATDAAPVVGVAPTTYDQTATPVVLAIDDASTSFTGNPNFAIDADYLGNITTTVPFDRQFSALQGANDVTTSSSWALSNKSPSGLDVSVDNTSAKGKVTIGAGIVSGSATLTATLPNGVPLIIPISVSKTNAAAPVSGGSGSTSGTITGLSGSSSSSYAVASSEIVVRSDGAGKLRFSFDIGCSGSGTPLANRNAGVKLSYATSSGGSLTDIVAEQTSGNYAPGSGIDGQISYGETQLSMPAPNTDYYFVAQTRKVGGAGAVSFPSVTIGIRQ